MFTIVKLLDSLDKAYSYICDQEKNAFYQESKSYKMLYIDSQSTINEYSNCSEKSLGICYVKKGYMDLNFDKNKISEYIIINKILE
jgi:hypothetical protein